MVERERRWKGDKKRKVRERERKGKSVVERNDGKE